MKVQKIALLVTIAILAAALISATHSNAATVTMTVAPTLPVRQSDPSEMGPNVNPQPYKVKCLQAC